MTGPAEPLSRDDAAILALESASIAGHTMKLLVLEPASADLDLDSLREIVSGRLAAEPRALMRVELEPPPARWAVDHGFAITDHVRRLEGTAGIDEAQMWAAAGEVMGTRLDRDRPLWALDLIGPLADGRSAIVARLHHAMVDGVTSVRFLEALLWDPEPGPPPDRRPTGSTRAAPRVSGLAEARRLPGALVRELAQRAAVSPLDSPIGSRRELAFVAMALEELKRIGHSRPDRATVNDVLLAAIAGGLREWLEPSAGRLPRLRAQIPVSLHARDADESDLGNRDSFLNVDLPLAEADPLRRLDLIRAETARRKRLGDADELYDFFHALARFKHLDRAVERFAAGPREFSLSISNVPGPRGAISVAGRRVERLCTVAEPAQRHALRVSAISSAGTVAVGLCTDPEALPGVEALATAIERSFAELRAITID